MMKRTLVNLAIAAALAGCGVTAQDEGSGSGSEIGGRAIDGYLAGSVVFVDTNENGILEAWESRAITDDSGYFSYNPDTQVNYCDLADGVPGSENCLRVPQGFDEVLIKVVAGYDNTFAAPFQGSMTLRASVSGDATALVFGSPLTTILSYMTEAERQVYLAAESAADGVDTFSEADLNSDFLQDFADQDATVDGKRRKLIRLALQAHKVADLLTTYLEDQYSFENGAKALFGEHTQFAGEAAQYVYQAMADALKQDASGGLNALLSSNSRMASVILAAQTLINTAINDYTASKNDDDPTVNTVPGSVANVDDRLAEFASFIATVLDPANTAVGASDEQDIKARLRAIEIVTGLLRDPAKVDALTMDARAQQAIDLATTAGDDTYLQNLSSAQAHVGLITQRFLDSATPGSLDATVADLSNRQTAADQIAASGAAVVSDPNTGLIQSGSISMSNADNGGSDDVDLVLNDDGSLSADIVFDGGADSPLNIDTTAEGSEPLAGSWSQNPDDPYTIYANVEVAGILQPVIITTNDDGSGYQFDFGGELVEWTTQ